jgi:hypothetical protein
LLIFLTDSEPLISFADATSQQVEPLAAALASRDLNASVQAYHDIVLKAAVAFEKEWIERIDFSMACAFSKNETLLYEVHWCMEDQVLAVLPLTKHLAPFYDALVCSRAYSEGIQERTVQTLNAIAEKGGRLVALLILHLLVVLHAAAADLLFESLAWFRYCHPADEVGVDATNTVAQHSPDASCPTQDDFHKALQLHWFKNDLWQALKRLLDSVAAQAVHIRTILYHCLSATLRKLGILFAVDDAALRQALWQLIVDADEAVYSQWHLRYMLTNLWYANTSTLAEGLSTLDDSVVSGWSHVVTDV